MAAAAIHGEETNTLGDMSVKTLLCQPCEEENKQLPAIGYCVNCREYLCQRCFDYHLVPSITKKHVLLDKEHIPPVEESDNNPMCSEHKDEEIKYHCASDSFAGCHICFFKHQKICKDAIYIPEVFESISISDEQHEINKKLVGVKDKCTELTTYIKHQKALIESHHDKTIAAMKQFKTESIDLIDKLEKEVTDQVNKKKEEDNLPLNALSKQCQTIMMNIQKITNRIETLQNQEHKCKAYITIQESKDYILKIEGEMKGVAYDKPIKQVVFKANDDLSEMLKSPFGLGSLQFDGVIDQADHVHDIDILADDDESTCACRSSVLLPDNKLIVTDMNNSSIKLVDIKQNKLISDLKFPSYPWAVCAISESDVAVTMCKEKKIAIVRTDPELSVQREIGVKGSPYGIGYHDGKFIVSYNDPDKVEIMDMQGIVSKIFDTDNNGKDLFCTPQSVAVHPRNGLIYVSDSDHHIVVCMKFDGTIVAKYEQSNLNFPMQIVFDRGNTGFVCGHFSDNLHVITEDCNTDGLDLLLDSDEGLDRLCSISYNESDDTIYIGQEDNYIKVFQIKYADV